MGIDIEAGGRVKSKTRVTKTPNLYLRLLCKLYKFLARRTDSKLNKVIFKRLNMTKRNTPPMSVQTLSKHMANKDGKMAYMVGTITDDKRITEVPKLTVCALKFTKTARARIIKAGGECMTFDKLALRSPLGQGTVRLRGPTKARAAETHFGKACSTPGGKAVPNLRSYGRKFEMARGRRKSCGYKA